MMDFYRVLLLSPALIFLKWSPTDAFTGSNNCQSPLHTRAWPSLPLESSNNLYALTPSENNEAFQEVSATGNESSFGRRQFISRAASTSLGICSSITLCPCGCGHSTGTPPANALAEITTPPSSLRQSYDLPRNSGADAFFSWNMATGMEGYEASVRPYKTRLFEELFTSLTKNQDCDDATIVEVGMGTFPNAPYYADALKSTRIKGLDIIGVDPNDSMAQYAKENAQKSGLLSPILPSSGSNVVSLRTVHGVAEALPFEDNSIDAIVATLTLCSVLDQERTLSEINRVLKPNRGRYLFWEHVLSETDGGLASKQKLLTPLQSFAADGCHLNRRTGINIRNARFQGGVEMEYLELEGYGLISPTVFGIASA